MNKETMKKLDAAGWPAFGLGYGRWVRVTPNGGLLAAGRVLRTPELLARAGQWVHVTLAGEVYSSELDLLVGTVPGDRIQPACAAAR